MSRTGLRSGLHAKNMNGSATSWEEEGRPRSGDIRPRHSRDGTCFSFLGGPIGPSAHGLDRGCPETSQPFAPPTAVTIGADSFLLCIHAPRVELARDSRLRHNACFDPFHRRKATSGNDLRPRAKRPGAEPVRLCVGAEPGERLCFRSFPLGRFRAPDPVGEATAKGIQPRKTRKEAAVPGRGPSPGCRPAKRWPPLNAESRLERRLSSCAGRSDRIPARGMPWGYR